MIKVIIADDHPLVREGIKKVLVKGDLEIEVIGEASESEELMDLLDKELPNLLILDIGMPGKSGLDMLNEIRQKYKDLRVLMLSMHPEDRFAVRALKAGAYGYLNKESVTGKLLNAIETIVNRNKRYISDKVAEQLVREVNEGESNTPHEKLSDREFEVMCMIASGKKIKEIAKDLSLSTRTIHTYRSRLMDKMGLRSNVAITRYALTHQLIEEP
ncbi:MAG: response regulator transcription factor [Gracilimonas sp.]|uniref:response regulator n=1 Tax=Gracilimonas sp. TaxID=1974203 RepID=UPI0019BC4B72|nr:response regulator transcription factor [Gracilimonas sp.]MBD3615411.1 response regulator transcription factor [Gracilimonas sp.]